MNAPDPGVARALEDLVARCRAEQTLETDHDSDWPSPCESGPPDAAGRVRWSPVRRNAWDLLDPLSETLAETVHPSLATYYGAWYSNGFETLATEGVVDLLGIWNEQDTLRLQQNLLGHALQQRKRRQPLTLFFACTEPDSDLVLSVLNENGRVVLELPGTDRREVVAPDLTTFLEGLTPRVA